jgi:tetratricopeptide (TPR) repeat protein
LFWKFFEFLVRLVYFKRFRQAGRIQKAVEIAGRCEADNALAHLDKIEPKLHPSIESIYWLTRGRILLAAGRLEQAEKAFVCSAKADPSNAKAHLDLAVVAGRRFRFDDARSRLEKLKSEADETEKKKACEILDLLDQVTSGEREKEFSRRAYAFAARAIGPGGESAGLPADLKLLDNWIDREPAEARKFSDEMALLIGQSEVTKGGATWKVSLAIEDSRIVLLNGREINPFEMISKRFSSQEVTLQNLFIECSSPEFGI